MSISNKEQFFLDSNFVISLLDDQDIHHQRARGIWADILKQDSQVFLSDVLINEVLSVLARRCGEKGKGRYFKKWARRFQKSIEGLPIACLYEFLPRHIPKIVSIMVRYRGCFNFHDALFVFFLDQLPTVHFVTFDKDFARVKDLKILSQFVADS